MVKAFQMLLDQRLLPVFSMFSRGQKVHTICHNRPAEEYFCNRMFCYPQICMLNGLCIFSPFSWECWVTVIILSLMDMDECLDCGECLNSSCLTILYSFHVLWKSTLPSSLRWITVHPPPAVSMLQYTYTSETRQTRGGIKLIME